MRFNAGMTDQIRIRVSTNEKKRLFAMARKRRMSVSELLRQVGNIDTDGRFNGVQA